MANAPKKKGTGGETELLRRFHDAGFAGRRTSPGLPFDLDITPAPNYGHDEQLNALATRPDHGRWLVTITLDDFLRLLGRYGWGARVEVKRYARFAHHAIYEDKFGR